MALDLSILYSASSSSSTGSASALAMYKKLQQTAEANGASTTAANEDSVVAEQIREMNNAAIRARNTLYKQDNARVASDAQYFQNRAASATTVDELVNDDRFLRVLAEANGMSDLYLSNKQRLKDVLTSDLNDMSSVARQGSARELELAKKYNLGATDSLTDVNGNLVGYEADGTLSNSANVVAALPAGLAKLQGVTVSLNGQAVLDSGGRIIQAGDIAASDAAAYAKAKTKTLLTETAASTSTSQAYEYDGQDYQIFINRSDVQREITYYKDNIGSVKSLDDLFANSRLLNFVLSAYDLEDEAQYPGKIRKILESDLTDVDSLANRFEDTRFKQLAQDLDVAANGMTKLTSSSTTDSLVQKYQQLEYERHLDEQAPGVRAAIEFSRRIQSATSTVSLLADSVMREVVTVANAIPKEIAYQEEDAQVAAVETKVDLAELKSDSNAVEKLVSRYLVLKDSGTSSGSNSYLLNLFS
ncbi:DUF1217 domain-containing protein [Ferrovibrio sp.]|uniref:DUF1217 domain-containing protein n=1 Tax=Ferrovibrio sp. TaxID=1917215 RepID=UPI003D11BD82